LGHVKKINDLYAQHEKRLMVTHAASVRPSIHCSLRSHLHTVAIFMKRKWTIKSVTLFEASKFLCYT